MSDVQEMHFVIKVYMN